MAQDYSMHSANDSSAKIISDYSYMMQAVPGGIVITKADDDFTLLYMNKGYYELVGYTPEEHFAKYHNVGLSTLHPDEAEEAAQNAKAQLAATGAFSLKAKLAHKYKDYIWVHFNGRLSMAEGEEPKIYIVIVDISEHIEVSQLLHREHEFNNLISSLTEDAFFDCDVLSGKMRYSKNFADRLGIDEIVENYPQPLIDKGIIAPESLLLYDNRFSSDSTDIVEEEIHFLLPDGKDAYYLCHYNIIRDENGAATRVVGKLTDITKQREKIDELANIAERDQLTGLYNKITTERLISETLKMRRHNDEKHALIMIDVDNFKTVNDMFGHLYGDIVLTQLADYLKQLFRADDVIGRVGGDEFFVFLKNFKALDHLKEKAAEICALFQKTYAEKDYTVEISASIGIAICEQNNMEFEQLYQNADTALYSAKAAGKNRYAFFDGNAGSTYNSVRTEIDTHGNIQKSFRENRVEFIFKLLYDSKTTVSSVHSVLQLITEHFGFSRGYIFENSEDGQYTSNTFEWCKNGIRPEIKNLQNVPIEAVSTAMSSFEKSGMFALYSIYDLSPVEWKVLEPQGIKSMFQFGIKDEGRYVGFIGFDDCEKQRTPTDSEIDEICTICNLLSMFLVKQRSLEKAQNNYKMMRSIIDSFDSYSYVVDVDTFEVLYENDNIQKHFKESAVGQICYEAYKNLDAPCPECLIADLKESAEGRVTKVTCDPLHNLCTKYTSCLVDWKNGRKACLNSRIDINCGVAD